MIVKYKLKCTTCDSTTISHTGEIPTGWARDHGGDLHCLKCWKLARALIKMQDSSGE